MASVQADTRSESRKRLDEMIASEPPLPPPDLPAGAQPRTVEDHLTQTGRQPFAVLGVVENGLVRPLDPQIKLPEHSRVIIVAQKT